MIPMTTQQARAHEKLLTILPVRTHSKMAMEPRKASGAHSGYGRKRNALQAAKMRAKIKEFRSLGWSSVKIAARLKVTRQCVWNYERKRDAR